MSCARWNFCEKEADPALRTAGLLEAAHQYSSQDSRQPVSWHLLAKHLSFHGGARDQQSSGMTAASTHRMTSQTSSTVFFVWLHCFLSTDPCKAEADCSLNKQASRQANKNQNKKK
jgi:hypothetical protein